MPRPRPISGYPQAYWDAFELACTRGSFTFQHAPNDVKRLVYDLRSFVASLRKYQHRDANRYGGVQIWIEPEGTPAGTILMQLRDNDSRLSSMQQALGEASRDGDGATRDGAGPLGAGLPTGAPTGAPTTPSEPQLDTVLTQLYGTGPGAPDEDDEDETPTTPPNQEDTTNGRS